MNVAACGIPWIPVNLIESFLKTKWKLIDYTSSKTSYEDVVKEEPIAVLSFSPPEEIRSAESIKWILSPGAGIDGLPISRIKEAGQKVINSHANAVAVAEQAWALLLSTSKQITKYDSQIRSMQKWPSPTQIRDVNNDLFDKTIGIVGYGAIGKVLETYAEIFGMEPVIFRKHPDETQYHISDLIEAASELDYLILACPLTEENRGMVSTKLLEALPSHAILVNIARGELVVEEDLFDALREGIIRGAGIDVWKNNPYRPDSQEGTPPEELIEVPNLVISPHRAWVSKKSFANTAKQLAIELDLIANNKESSHLVDLNRGY